MKLLFYALFASLIVASCSEKGDTNVVGYKPIYSKAGDEKHISNDVTNTSIKNAGRIYLKDNYFFQVDVGRGVQVYDVTDKKNPLPVNFISIYGIQEISVKNNYLYASSLNDIVIVDISAITEAQLLKRMDKAFEIVTTTNPPESGIFECVDLSKGDVIGWEKATIVNGKCRL